METCNISRHQGKDSKGGRKSVPPFPTRSAAPAQEQRSPPTVQTKRGAGRNEEGLPLPERPATGPAPLSLPPVRPNTGKTTSTSPTSSKRPNMHQPITSSAEAAPVGAAAAIFTSGPNSSGKGGGERGGERGKECEGHSARAP